MFYINYIYIINVFITNNKESIIFIIITTTVACYLFTAVAWTVLFFMFFFSSFSVNYELACNKLNANMLLKAAFLFDIISPFQKN